MGPSQYIIILRCDALDAVDMCQYYSLVAHMNMNSLAEKAGCQTCKDDADVELFKALVEADEAVRLM